MSKPNKFLKLSNAGIQMGLVIGGGAYLGNYLDQDSVGTPVWTVLLSLVGVAIGLYIVIKEVMQITKSNERKDDEKE
jgi:F0F1-type ATP synthase assembly protein I